MNLVLELDGITILNKTVKKKGRWEMWLVYVALIMFYMFFPKKI